MSVLLYLPGILLILFKRRGLIGALQHIVLVIATQMLIAIPFIRSYPRNYLASAFEFSRVFLYKWTVNWRFVPETIFLSRQWAYALLAGHVCTLCLFAGFKWCRSDGGVVELLIRGIKYPTSPGSMKATSADRTFGWHCLFRLIKITLEIIIILLTSNLIGIIFARSLHYQFYSWYAQQLPFLLWHTKYPVILRYSHLILILPLSSLIVCCLRIIILFCVEYAWNIFPSTISSSGILLISNIMILVGIWFGFPEGKQESKQLSKVE